MAAESTGLLHDDIDVANDVRTHTHVQPRETSVHPRDEVRSGLPPPTISSSLTEPEVTKPNLGRILAMATLAASLVLILGITFGMAAGEHTGWIDGLAVALLATFWGGPGFGLLFGGALWIHRQELWEARQTALGATLGIHREER